MNSKKFLAFAMAAAMTLSMTACGGSGSGAASSGTDSAAGTAFKLGGTGPLTGGASIYGLAAQRGAQIAVDEINAQGGAIQFDLKYEDDQHDPEKAVNAYNALKEGLTYSRSLQDSLRRKAACNRLSLSLRTLA